MGTVIPTYQNQSTIGVVDMTSNNFTTKSQYIEVFDCFAKTAIKLDGENLPYLYGHCVNVQQFGNGSWDVAICNQKEYAKQNYAAFLGTGKLNNICATLPEIIEVKNLDGERFFQVDEYQIEWLKEWLLENRIALGIKKRVQVSESRRQAFISSVSRTAGELK